MNVMVYSFTCVHLFTIVCPSVSFPPFLPLFFTLFPRIIMLICHIPEAPTNGSAEVDLKDFTMFVISQCLLALLWSAH